MIDEYLDGMAVSIDDCSGAIEGQTDFLLHISSDGCEFLDGLVDDAESVLVDGHDTLTDLFIHFFDIFFGLT